MKFAYNGNSNVHRDGNRQVLEFEPNLAREPVAFDALLAKPLRFREAISALHDVVISNLRYQKRDKSAYHRWKQQQKDLENQLRKNEYERLKKELEQKRESAVTPELEKKYDQSLKKYWDARRKYDRYLREHDKDLWRKIMPYDPVITVADDVVFFECFSADESSYGCLSVNREDGFGPADLVQYGTTNVDYSWDLYHHFQSLRNYRDTRFRIDPQGFEVQMEGSADYREEKIDLPPGWLRGFLQIQGAMGLPMQKVSLSQSAVYSLLAWLKRHREKHGPRAIRFELTPDAAPRLMLEPWEMPIVSRETIYEGARQETIRVWGRRRLMLLSRVLPLAEGIDVYLLGTGLPSFWIIRMGEMYLTIGLSGWTANDWTRGSSLDMLAPPAKPEQRQIEDTALNLQSMRAATFDDLVQKLNYSPAVMTAILNYLAHTGQVVYDLEVEKYRWRQVLPKAIAEEEIQPVNYEQTEANRIVNTRKFIVERKEVLPEKGIFVQGKADGKPTELLLDFDSMIKRGKCVCDHYRRYGFRNGPCAHMLALRLAIHEPKQKDDSFESWYNRLRNPSVN